MPLSPIVVACVLLAVRTQIISAGVAPPPIFDVPALPVNDKTVEPEDRTVSVAASLDTTSGDKKVEGTPDKPDSVDSRLGVKDPSSGEIASSAIIVVPPETSGATSATATALSTASSGDSPAAVDKPVGHPTSADTRADVPTLTDTSADAPRIIITSVDGPPQKDMLADTPLTRDSTADDSGMAPPHTGNAQHPVFISANVPQGAAEDSSPLASPTEDIPPPIEASADSVIHPQSPIDISTLRKDPVKDTQHKLPTDLSLPQIDPALDVQPPADLALSLTNPSIVDVQPSSDVAKPPTDVAHSPEESVVDTQPLPAQLPTKIIPDSIDSVVDAQPPTDVASILTDPVADAKSPTDFVPPLKDPDSKLLTGLAPPPTDRVAVKKHKDVAPSPKDPMADTQPADVARPPKDPIAGKKPEVVASHPTDPVADKKSADVAPPTDPIADKKPADVAPLPTDPRADKNPADVAQPPTDPVAEKKAADVAPAPIDPIADKKPADVAPPPTDPISDTKPADVAAPPIDPIADKKSTDVEPPPTDPIADKKPADIAPPPTDPIADKKPTDVAPPPNDPIADKKPADAAPIQTDPIADKNPADVAPPPTDPIADKNHADVAPPPTDPIADKKPTDVAPPSTDPIADKKPADVAPPPTDPIADKKPTDVAPPSTDPIAEKNPADVAPPTTDPIADKRPADVAPPQTDPFADTKPADVAPPPTDPIADKKPADVAPPPTDPITDKKPADVAPPPTDRIADKRHTDVAPPPTDPVEDAKSPTAVAPHPKEPLADSKLPTDVVPPPTDPMTDSKPPTDVASTQIDTVEDSKPTYVAPPQTYTMADTPSIDVDVAPPPIEPVADTQPTAVAPPPTNPMTDSKTPTDVVPPPTPTNLALPIQLSVVKVQPPQTDQSSALKDQTVDVQPPTEVDKPPTESALEAPPPIDIVAPPTGLVSDFQPPNDAVPPETDAVPSPKDKVVHVKSTLDVASPVTDPVADVQRLSDVAPLPPSIAPPSIDPVVGAQPASLSDLAVDAQTPIAIALHPTLRKPELSPQDVSAGAPLLTSISEDVPPQTDAGVEPHPLAAGSPDASPPIHEQPVTDIAVDVPPLIETPADVVAPVDPTLIAPSPIIPMVAAAQPMNKVLASQPPHVQPFLGIAELPPPPTHHLVHEGGAIVVTVDIGSDMKGTDRSHDPVDAPESIVKDSSPLASDVISLKAVQPPGVSDIAPVDSTTQSDQSPPANIITGDALLPEMATKKVDTPTVDMGHPPPIFIPDANYQHKPVREDSRAGNAVGSLPSIDIPISTTLAPPPPIIAQILQNKPVWQDVKPSVEPTNEIKELYRPPENDPRFMTVSELAEMTLLNLERQLERERVARQNRNTAYGLQVFFNTPKPKVSEPTTSKNVLSFRNDNLLPPIKPSARSNRVLFNLYSNIEKGAFIGTKPEIRNIPESGTKDWGLSEFGLDIGSLNAPKTSTTSSLPPPRPVKAPPKVTRFFDSRDVNRPNVVSPMHTFSERDTNSFMSGRQDMPPHLASLHAANPNYRPFVQSDDLFRVPGVSQWLNELKLHSGTLKQTHAAGQGTTDGQKGFSADGSIPSDFTYQVHRQPEQRFSKPSATTLPPNNVITRQRIMPPPSQTQSSIADENFIHMDELLKLSNIDISQLSRKSENLEENTKHRQSDGKVPNMQTFNINRQPSAANPNFIHMEELLKLSNIDVSKLRGVNANELERNIKEQQKTMDTSGSVIHTNTSGTDTITALPETIITTTMIPTAPPIADAHPPAIFDTKVVQTFMPFPKFEPTTQPTVSGAANTGLNLTDNAAAEKTGPCDGCIYVNERCLLPHPVHCHMYTECVRQGRFIRSFTRTCAMGSFFDRKHFLCVDPKNTDCPTDRCREPGLKAYSIFGHCRHYWVCGSREGGEGGSIFAQAECCPANGGFKDGEGCVANPNCTDSCHSEINRSPPAACDCAPGTLSELNGTNCTCGAADTPGNSTFGAGTCKPMLKVTFDGAAIEDRSNTNQHVGVEGVAASRAGQAIFTGDGRLVLWRYANLMFTDVFAVSFRFHNNVAGPRFQTLVSNCNQKNGQPPSFEIKLDTVYTEVIFSINTYQSHAKTFKIYYQLKTWVHVELIYDGERIVGSVDGRVRNIMAAGGIETRPSPLSVGGCGGKGGLKGSIDDIYIYEECIPDSMYGTFVSVLE